MDILKNNKTGKWLSPGKIALIVLLSPVYILVFGELFMRVFAGVALMPRYVTGGDDGIRQNIPNSVYSQTSQEVDVEIRVNGQGLRADRDFDLEKPEGVCRIAVLGDSFFMGYEVNLEDSFSYLLEANLAEHKHNCEVLNFSVSGFGTAEYIVALESRVLPFKPDLIIFELHATDLRENIISNLYRLENGELQRTGNNYLPAIGIRDKLMQYAVYRWLIERSQLYSVVREKAGKTVKSILLAKNNMKNLLSQKTTPDSIKAAEAETEADKANKPDEASELLNALLEYGQEVAAKNNANFMLVDIPNGFDPPNYYSVLDKEMKEYNLADRFHLTSPMDVFTDPQNAKTLYYYQKGHLHLSIEGNHVVADKATDLILQKSLLADVVANTTDQ